MVFRGLQIDFLHRYYQARKLGVAITFHGLRNTFATIAQRMDVPIIVISEMLGHTTTAITADLYTHVFDDTRREASDRVGSALAAARRRAQ